MVGLGVLNSHFNSAAYGVSADGSVIVGTSWSGMGSEAFLWTADSGMQNLRDLLIAVGATELENWGPLYSATGISADGRTIVGQGRNPDGNLEAWIATLPQVSSAPEPSTFVLAGFGALAVVVFARRRRPAQRRSPRPAKRSRTITLILSTWLGLDVAYSHAASFTFQGMGDLPGGNYSSSALAVSADGSVVVGSGRSAGGNEAFRWTSAGGMVGLGELGGGNFLSIAYGVSADGSIVTGWSTSASGEEAFYWAGECGMLPIGDLPGGGHKNYGHASAISSDGSTVVGWGSSASGDEAFRWTRSGGIAGLGDLPGGSFSSVATAVSSDGSVVVGASRSIDDGGHEAFRWTSEGGMVGLGDLTGGGFGSGAYGVSADGSVVVGTGNSASGNEAFRWTSEGGMVGLGDLPGGIAASQGNAVSADGSIVLGSAWSDAGREAFLWTAAGGMQSLRDLLIAGGATGLEGWTLTSAAAISADRRTIVGGGRNPDGNFEAWIATVPEPSALVLSIGGLLLLLPKMVRCRLSATSSSWCLRRLAIVRPSAGSGSPRAC
jgi:probable HAF family extracellular repeat protein